jgi:hypothetical protein
VPAQQRRRRDDPRPPQLAGQQARQRGQQQPVLRLQPCTIDLPAPHRDLVTQHQQLHVLGCLATGPKHDKTEHRPHHRVQDQQQHPNHPANPQKEAHPRLLSPTGRSLVDVL